MRKYLLLLFACTAFISCKSTKSVTTASVDTSLSAKSVVSEHQNRHSLDFKTVVIKGSTKYNILSPTLDIRIKKDEIILVSVRVPIAGTVIKAMATPESVSYYNKLEQEYFEGDFEFISDWLGTSVDFQKLQNLVLGRPMESLAKGSYTLSVEELTYKLQHNSNQLEKNYWLDGGDFKLIKQEFNQKNKKRSAAITYSKFKKQNNLMLPFVLSIESESGKKKNNFKIDYNSFEFDTEISFPYQVPQGYKAIEID